MTTQEVANKLVEYCRQGQWEKAQEELYSENAVSIEPPFAPQPRTEGMEGIRQKGKQWEAMVEEVHSVNISEPAVAGPYFTCSMVNDVTFKGMGRTQIQEVCVYKVEDGKVVSEQFFYPAPPQQ